MNALDEAIEKIQHAHAAAEEQNRRILIDARAYLLPFLIRAEERAREIETFFNKECRPFLLEINRLPQVERLMVSENAFEVQRVEGKSSEIRIAIENAKRVTLAQLTRCGTREVDWRAVCAAYTSQLRPGAVEDEARRRMRMVREALEQRARRLEIEGMIAAPIIVNVPLPSNRRPKPEPDKIGFDPRA